MRTDKPDDLRPELFLRPGRPWKAALALFVAAGLGGAVGASTIAGPDAYPPYVVAAVPDVALAESPVEPAVAEAAEVADAVHARREDKPEPQVLQVMGRGPERWALLVAKADKSWLRGAPVVAHADPEAWWVERSVAIDEAALPEGVRGWTGRGVDVVDRDGNRCAAEIEAVTGRQFGFEIEEPSDVGTTVPGDWHSTAIVGKLRIDDPRCGAPLYAMTDTEALLHGASTPAKGKLAQRARRAFRNLPGYTRLQAEWTSDDFGGTGPWDAGDGSHDVFDVRLGAGRFVLVAGRGEGCGGPDGELVGLWRVKDAGGKPRLGELVFAGTTSVFTIDAVFDADGDDLPDFIVGQDLATAALHSAGGDYQVEPGFAFDYDFCRC